MQLTSRFVVTSAVCVALAAGAASLRGSSDIDPIVGEYEGMLCGSSQDWQNGKPVSHFGLNSPFDCAFDLDHGMFAICDGTWKKKGSKYAGNCSPAFQQVLAASAPDGEKVKGVIRLPEIFLQEDGVFGKIKSKVTRKSQGNTYRLKQIAEFVSLAVPPVQV